MNRQTILILFAGLLGACGNGGSPPPPPPPSPQPITMTMDAASWKFLYSPGMPATPSPDAGGWSFDFPSENGVHMIAQSVCCKLGKVSTTFSIVRSDPAAQLQEVDRSGCDGTSPPKVRVMFARRGNTFGGDQPDHRWWGVDAYDLRQVEPGALVHSADPNRWSNVFGQNGADRVQQWTAAANDVAEIMYSFGGCFGAHGVFKLPGAGFVRFIATGFTAKDE